MISRLQITAIATVVVLAVAGSLAIAGESVSVRLFTSITVAVSAVGVAVAVFDKWIWRLRLLQGWFVQRPHLWGRWKAQIASQWTDGNGARREPIAATFTIGQTYSRVSIRMESNDSSGVLVAANIVRCDDGSYRLVGIYRNDPRLALRDSSTIHYGAFMLDVEGHPNAPERLRGQYWTDRDTKGEIVASNRDVRLVT